MWVGYRRYGVRKKSNDQTFGSFKKEFEAAFIRNEFFKIINQTFVLTNNVSPSSCIYIYIYISVDDLCFCVVIYILTTV